MTKGLYDLFRFSSSGASISPIPTAPAETPGILAFSPAPNPQSDQTKQCPNCLANNPLDVKICSICGTAI